MSDIADELLQMIPTMSGDSNRSVKTESVHSRTKARFTIDDLISFMEKKKGVPFQDFDIEEQEHLKHLLNCLSGHESWNGS
ncbi:MAG: hypothetical protein KA436_12250 [Oligoflexales bacterium]|nr:hypothetical protein [Oligoflexales bacterium]